MPEIDYDAVLADLEAKKAHLESVIAGLKGLMALGGVAMMSGSGAPKVANGGPRGDAEIAADAFFGQSIPEAIKNLLEMVRRPMTAPAIAEGLRKGGFATTSADFTNTVGAALRRQSQEGDIVRVGNTADWGLREWYPGLRRRRGGKLAGEGPDAETTTDGGGAE